MVLCLAIALLIPTGAVFAADEVSVSKVIVTLKDTNKAEMSLIQWGDFMDILLSDEAKVSGIVASNNLPFDLIMWGQLYPDELASATEQYQWTEGLVRGTIIYKEVSGQDWYEYVPPATVAPTVSNITFDGVAQTIATDNTISVIVDPGKTYTTASVTLSQKARVTVVSGSTSKSAIVPAGTLNNAVAIAAFTSQTEPTGQKLISITPVTVTLQAVDASENDIPDVKTVYTVNFVSQ